MTHQAGIRAYRVNGEAYDDDGDAELARGADMALQIGQTLLQQLEVLLGVLRGEGRAGGDGWAAAVHLGAADCTDDHHA